MARASSLTLAVGLLCGFASFAGEKAKDRESLRRTLDELLKASPLKDGRVAVHVASLDDGSVVFAHRPDELLNPASNVKLVTAAAALFVLGPDFRFETEFLTEPEYKDGKARVLYVRGKGDPSVTTERLYGMVSELMHAGLTEVGEVVVDEGYFDGERLAPGYDQEKSDRAYMAPSGAVSLNWNSVGIYLRPGAGVGTAGIVELEPPSDYFVVESRLSTGNRNQRRFNVSSDPDRDKVRQRVLITGTVPYDRGTWSVWKKIDAPGLYFGQTLKQLLVQRGVKVKGKVRLGVVPPAAKLYWVNASDTLDLVLKRLNKHSSNFVAEQLIKTLGAEGKGSPGSFEKGIAVVEDFLEREVGVARGSFVMKNGSGLNDTNRFSAAQLTKVLRFMYERFPLAPEYLSALGIAGKDGTLRYRFEGSDAVGRLRAKTGTLQNVSALSGYVQAMGGEKLIFSVMANDFPGRAANIVQHIDALAAAVAATGSLDGPGRAAYAMTHTPVFVGPADELKARVKTYAALARQQDRRNVSFLRTALRAEKDPAVRAVVAHALFESDPQDYLAARALLDNFTASDDVYGRLRAVALDPAGEVPGVSGVVELAAGGNSDAITRVLELCRAAGDERSASQLAKALADIARAAPEELVLALHKALPAERDAGITLLAKGLSRAADPQHPFWPVLRRSMGSLDPRLAAAARATEAALAQRIAEEKAPRVSEALPSSGPATSTQGGGDVRPGG